MLNTVCIPFNFDRGLISKTSYNQIWHQEKGRHTFRSRDFVTILPTLSTPNTTHIHSYGKILTT